MNRLIFRDAPLRSALELYFRTVGNPNYIIDNAVQGIVTGSGMVERDTFPEHLFPGMAHQIRDNVIFIRQLLTAVVDKRVEEVLAQKLTNPLVFGEPRRVAGVAIRGGMGTFALLERGYPVDSEIRIVGIEDRFGEAKVREITDKGIVLSQSGQSLAIPLTGLIPRVGEAPIAASQVRTLIFADTSLSWVLELIRKAGGPELQWEGIPESYISAELENIEMRDFPKILASLPIALAFTRANGVWKITPRSQPRATPPRFVSLDEVSQGRVQLPLVAGAPRRVSVVLLGERPLALLETGKLPALQRQVVAEGDLLDGFRVSQIERMGVVLQKGDRSFLVPLVPFNPIL
jgi:hypothetical protein